MPDIPQKYLQSSLDKENGPAAPPKHFATCPPRGPHSALKRDGL